MSDELNEAMDRALAAVIWAPTTEQRRSLLEAGYVLHPKSEAEIAAARLYLGLPPEQK